MKKLLLVFVAFCLLSCSMDEEEPIPFSLELMGIQSVEIPDFVTPGEEYEVKVYYRRPTECHYFEGLLYEVEGPVCTVAAQGMVVGTDNCQPMDALSALEQATFTFTCPENYQYGYYVFKFYTGGDGDGLQTFDNIEVPVVQ